MNQSMWLIFADMDDTLLNKEKKVTEENMNAILAALSVGHKFVVNSGRPMANLINVVDNLGLNRTGCYCIGCNGGELYDCGQKKMIYQRGLPRELAREIMEAAGRYDLYVHTYSDTELLVKENTRETEYYTRYVKLPVHADPEILEHLPESVCKVLIIDLDGRTKMDQYRSEMAEKLSGRSACFYSNPYYLEHVPEHVSKGDAIIELCRILSVPVEHTIAFGDEENDLPMLKTAGIGAAMANAVPALKKVADYITEHDCNHSGVAEGILKFVPGVDSQI